MSFIRSSQTFNCTHFLVKRTASIYRMIQKSLCTYKKNIFLMVNFLMVTRGTIGLRRAVVMGTQLRMHPVFFEKLNFCQSTLSFKI
jgi:hypothetical protein